MVKNEVNLPCSLEELNSMLNLLNSAQIQGLQNMTEALTLADKIVGVRKQLLDVKGAVPTKEDPKSKPEA